MRSFGIIGGGAVLFAASSVIGQAVLPAVGGEKNITTGNVSIIFFQVLEQPALEQVRLALEQPARLRSVSREVVSVVPSNPPQGAGLDVQLPASSNACQTRGCQKYQLSKFNGCPT